MQREERIEAGFELRRIIGAAVRDVVATLEPAAVGADLLASACAARREILLPALGSDQRRSLPGEHARLRSVCPPLRRRQLLAQDDVPTDHGFERALERPPREAAFGGADGAQLVTRSVAEKPKNTNRPRTPQVEGNDCHEGPVGGAARDDKASSALAEMTPPQRGPFPRRKDVPARERKPLPVFANRLDVFDDLGFEDGVVHERSNRRSPNTSSTSEANVAGRLPSAEACSRRKKR